MLSRLASWEDSTTSLIKDGGTAALLWLAAVIVPWREIRAEAKLTAGDDFPDGEYDSAQAEFLFALGRQDSDHTDDKAKHLLGLSSALAAVLIVFAPDVSPTWLAFAPTLPLLFAVMLCIRQLGVRTEMVPVPDQKDGGPSRDTWAYDVLKSYRYNERRRLFLVDLFSASRRWLSIALILMVVIAVLRESPPDPVASEVAQLRHTVQAHQIERTLQLEQLRSALDSISEAWSARRSVDSAEVQ